MSIKMDLIQQSFYERDTLIVAKDLIGCLLVCQSAKNGLIQIGRIVETEAYKQDDPASHSYCGKTQRSITMFKDPGLTYVYFTYGMYHCLNVVTEPVDVGCAVLIRAIEPIQNIQNTNGPAKLCREMNISKLHNELKVFDENSSIRIYKSENVSDVNIVQTTRIGIKKASDYPWRFYDKTSAFVSKK